MKKQGNNNDCKRYSRLMNSVVGEGEELGSDVECITKLPFSYRIDSWRLELQKAYKHHPDKQARLASADAEYWGNDFDFNSTKDC